MSGRTHALAGTMTSLVFLPHAGIKHMLVGVAISIFGALLPDIDSEYSVASKWYKVLLPAILAFILYCMAEAVTKHYGIIAFIMEWKQKIIPAMAIIILCIIGKHTAHRTFTHSIFATLLFTFLVKAVTEEYYICFLIGYSSHIALDLLNKKPERLFWPFKKGVCFKLCNANGHVDNYIGVFLAIMFFVFAKQSFIV